MLHWWQYAQLPEPELARVDIAVLNLACAGGLPGADEIDVDYCLYKLHDWALAVREYTFRLMPQFRRKPKEYENSEAYFRALVLITVLQRDMGVRYNPTKIPEDAPFDTADSFIHGVIQGNGGTCATLPVVYAAVGRRLGYPIRLVATRGASGHLFCRWDDPKTGERFNIEAAGHGLSTPSDDYFRDGRYEMSARSEIEGCYLQSMTPRMELAGFLAGRAWRWEDVKDWWQCVDSWAWAASLVPENVPKQNSLKRAMIEWDKEQQRCKPVGFPLVLARARCRKYPDALPLELEEDIGHLTATHHLLTDPRLEEKYWSRMRRGDYTRVPTVALAEFAEDNSCRIHLRFD